MFFDLNLCIVDKIQFLLEWHVVLNSIPDIGPDTIFLECNQISPRIYGHARLSQFSERSMNFAQNSIGNGHISTFTQVSLSRVLLKVGTQLQIEYRSPIL